MKATLLANYRFKKNFLLFLIVFIMLSYAVAAYLYYESKKSDYYAQVDATLKKAALAADMILPEAFHDRAVDKEAVTPEEDAAIMYRLSELASVMGVEYVYSMVQRNGVIYFTSSSATPEEIKNGEIYCYFDIYEDATDAFKEAFRPGYTLYEEASDIWGSFHSVSIGRNSPGGNTYIIGADFRIDDINKALKTYQTNTLIAFLLIFVFLLLLLYLHLRFSRRELMMIFEAERRLLAEIQDATATLSQSNDRLEEAQRLALMGNFEQRHGEPVIHFSREGHRVWNIAPESEITLETLLTLIDDDDKPALEALFERRYTAEVAECTVRLDAEDTVKHIHLQSRPIRDTFGNFTGVMGTCQDITEQVLNARKIKEQEALLFQRDRLKHLSEMVSMIAHQWRQPLATIGAILMRVSTNIQLNADKPEGINIVDLESAIRRIETLLMQLSDSIEDFRHFYAPDESLTKASPDIIITNVLETMHAELTSTASTSPKTCAPAMRSRCTRAI
jgi:PAS domain-containing protein